MNNLDLKYIENNFVEIQELAKVTKYKVAEIEELITQQIIPNYSYSINFEITIQSALQDSCTIMEQKKYFGKHVIDILLQLKNKPSNANQQKEIFKNQFFEALKNHAFNEDAYNNSFENNDNQLNEIFEEEWQHYCNGIYGICTLQASAQQIVEKEIAVKRLIAFNNKHAIKKLSEIEKIEFESLNLAYNNVSQLFAPYQRQASSRGKYLDTILNNNNMDTFVKKYD